eukprot:1190696-Prorocentrum_minimum.AAC.1
MHHLRAHRRQHAHVCIPSPPGTQDAHRPFSIRVDVLNTGMRTRPAGHCSGERLHIIGRVTHYRQIGRNAKSSCMHHMHILQQHQLEPQQVRKYKLTTGDDGRAAVVGLDRAGEQCGPPRGA